MSTPTTADNTEYVWYKNMSPGTVICSIVLLVAIGLVIWFLATTFKKIFEHYDENIANTKSIRTPHEEKYRCTTGICRS